jgi:hypothetical protein
LDGLGRLLEGVQVDEDTPVVVLVVDDIPPRDALSYSVLGDLEAFCRFCYRESVEAVLWTVLPGV